MLPFSAGLIKLLLGEAVSLGYEPMVMSPSEAVVQELRVCGVSALSMTLPILLYHALAFWNCPKGFSEKMRVLLGVAVSVSMFALGMLFAIKVMLPFSLSFLADMTKSLETVRVSITLEKYIGFYLSETFIFGMIMELPVLAYVLSRAGLLTRSILKKARPYAIIAIFVIAAIITPPDVTSQLLVGIPMLAVYELCCLITGLFARKKEELPDGLKS